MDKAPKVAAAAATVATIVGLGGAMVAKLRAADVAVAATDKQPAPVATAAHSFEAPRTDSPELNWWRESMKTHDQRMQWFRKARFGMFIHWGVYSELGGVWHGQPVQGYAEHIMRKAKIPIETYKKEVAGQFDPVKFNADEWVRLARQAGMGYIVITSKHHDGFAMFDDDVTDYNVVKDTPWHHDPMKDLKAATQKQGLRFGFYYSQAWDWGDPDGTGNDWDFDRPGGDRNLHGGKTWWDVEPQEVAKVQKYVDGKAIPQIRELVAKYQPDLIWFDTPSKMPPLENYRVIKALRQASPDVVINSRCVGALGDYQSTSDRPAEFPPHDGDWEAIPTTNESYGWHQSDHSHKPPSHFIQLLAKAAAKGGNLMLNVGPRGDGTIDPPDVNILEGIGKWMAVNGESIHGTERTPLAVQAWGQSTYKPLDKARGVGNTLYLHVFDWPKNGKLTVGGLKSNVRSAYLLADPHKRPLKVTRAGDLDVDIAVPAEPPDRVDAVIVVQCEGDTIDTEKTRLISNTMPNQLVAFDGQLHGTTFKFGQGKKENAYVQNWSKPDEYVTWPVRVKEAEEYDVSVAYDAEPSSQGNLYQAMVGPQTFQAQVQPGTEQSQTLGHVKLEPGVTELKVSAAGEIKGGELMRLRAITLAPK